MAEKKISPFNVEALEKSLNDSATRVSALWVSFLIFGLYLIIAAATVGKLSLLLRDPIKLPVLNVDLPLIGFYCVAPALFVIFHTYLILQVLLLGRTAAAYNESLGMSIHSARASANLRQRLANTLFAQLFAGSPRERTGWLGILLSAMAWFSLAIAPTFVLLVFQFTFLPFHDTYVTWEHRLLILLELAVVFVIWPLALEPNRDFEWRRLYMSWHVWATSGLFAVVSMWLLSFPGEFHVGRLSDDRTGPSQCERFPSWLASIDRLDLPRVDVVDDERYSKIDKSTIDRGLKPHEGERTRSFRERDLNCSDFSKGDLRRADFASAQAIGSNWEGAHLQGASLEGLKGRGIKLGQSRLQEASLVGADLTLAELGSAQIAGADFRRAQLSGADLQFAQGRGSDFTGASLEGVRFFFSDLRGAHFLHATLRCAMISASNFQGADLSEAQLQGASLSSSRFQGVNFRSTQLQAADIAGIDLGNAQLTDVYIWKTKIDDCKAAHVEHVNFTPYIQITADYDQSGVEASRKNLVALFNKCRATFDLKERIEALLSGKYNSYDERWKNCENESSKVTAEERDARFIATLVGIVCRFRERNPHGILNVLGFSGTESTMGTGQSEAIHRATSGFYPKVARALLSERHCPALEFLAKGDLEELREVAREQPLVHQADPTP